MPNLANNYCVKLDFLNVDQYVAGKRLIQGTKNSVAPM